MTQEHRILSLVLALAVLDTLHAIAQVSYPVYNGATNGAMISATRADGSLSVVNGLVPGSINIAVSTQQGVHTISSDTSNSLFFEGRVIGSVTSAGYWNFTLPLTAQASKGDPISLTYKYYGRASGGGSNSGEESGALEVPVASADGQGLVFSSMETAIGSGGTLFVGDKLVSGSVQMKILLSTGGTITIISDASNKLYCLGKVVGLVTGSGAWSFGLPLEAGASKGDRIRITYQYNESSDFPTRIVTVGSKMTSQTSAYGSFTASNGLVPGAVSMVVSCKNGNITIYSDSANNLVYWDTVVGGVTDNGDWSFKLPLTANAQTGDSISITYKYYVPVASYKVAFKANGGKGKMVAQKMTYGKAAKLRKNAFTRQGRVFAGWATDKDYAKKGLIAYKDAQSVKNLRADGKTTTLYAVWAKPAYKVKFYASGGKGKMDVQSFTYGKAKKLNANKFKRKGYAFKGWAKSKALAKKGKVAYKNKKKVTNLVTTGKTVKLYAVWKKKK